MKKHYLILTAAAGLSLCMTSCSQSEDVTENTSAKQAITFVSEDETTRTSMGGAYTDSSFPFYWEVGDAIWVNATDQITGNNTGTASNALFKGNVTTSAPYKIRYTGTGSYSSTNPNLSTPAFSTSSNANQVVIPMLQSVTLGSTKHFGASGDCGTATATGPRSDGSYKFKLDHKASYLMLLPRWEGNDGTYKLKSVMVTTHNKNFLLAGRFSFDDNGIGSTIANTSGSSTIKITIGDGSGVVLPTATDQTKSVNIAIKPITKTDLYCIYDVTDGTHDYYICKIIPASTMTQGYAANKITPITANLKGGYDAAVNDGYLGVITDKNPYYNYCEWGVPAGEPFFINHEMNDDYDNNPYTITIDDNNAPSPIADGYKTFAQSTDFSKENLPTFNQITWYLAAGVYYDANQKWGPGDNQVGGVWFKKKSKIIGNTYNVYDHSYVDEEGNTQNVYVNKTVTAETFNTTSSYLTSLGDTDDQWIVDAPSDLSTNWFFLPFSGRYVSADGTLDGVGIEGDYWSSTVYSSTESYTLLIQTIGVSLSNNTRKSGQSLWSAQ
jgi:hypothetical protein